MTMDTASDNQPNLHPSKVWMVNPSFADDDFIRLIAYGWQSLKYVRILLPCFGEERWRSVLVHFPKLVARENSVLGVDGKTLEVAGKGCVILRCARNQSCRECPWLKKLETAGFEIRGPEGWFENIRLSKLPEPSPYMRDGYWPLADVYDGYKNLRNLFPVGSKERSALEENMKLLSVRDVVDDGRVDDPGDTKGESAPGGDGCCEIRGVHAPHSTTRPPVMPIVGIVGGLLAVVAGSLTSTPEFFCTFGAVCFVVNLFFLFRLSD